jgi:predicted DNA-binding transcriptional regulator YafY
MRRADRLFQIIQGLHHDRVVTARHLAQTLQVSERTIYRDIQDLSLSGVPITGEAGLGYRLMKGFHLSPLMFNEEELAALLLGARMVQTWTDKGLARAAHQAMAKIEHVIPDHLKPELDRQEIMVPGFAFNGMVAEEFEALRGAIKQQRKVHFDYQREDGGKSTRTVHPLGLFYWGKVWTLVAWCELRDGFRHFRLDRMSRVAKLEAHYTLLQGRTLQDFLAQCEQSNATG